MLIFEIIFHDEVQLLRNVSAQVLTFASYEAAKGHRQRPPRKELKNNKKSEAPRQAHFLLNFSRKLPPEGPGRGAVRRRSKLYTAAYSIPCSKVQCRPVDWFTARPPASLRPAENEKRGSVSNQWNFESSHIWNIGFIVLFGPKVHFVAYFRREIERERPGGQNVFVFACFVLNRGPI